jgi:ribosomal protein S18 acetylase RimI-like enzyme
MKVASQLLQIISLLQVSQLVSSFLLPTSTSTFTSTSTKLHIFGEATATATPTAVRPPEENGEETTVVPFMIEELTQAMARDASDDISDLVIEVFFEEEAELKEENRGKMTPFKVMQLAYLKNLQNGDVKGKKFLLNRGINNSMFAARQIVPDYSGSKLKKGEQLDITTKNKNKNKDGELLAYTTYNTEYLPNDTDTFKRGPLLGFVDVSEKTFGLASDSKSQVDLVNDDDNSSSPINERTLRPVLTNLSVYKDGRKSGVGSALVDACEDVVMTEWSTTYDEMVLEVEEENGLAQQFYEKRGYVKLYSDPSARRFDTSGIILREVRTAKICYRKGLTLNKSSGSNSGGGLFDLPFFAKVKEVLDGMN